MAVRPLPQATPTVIQQGITSGNFFTGALPAGDPVVDASNALWKYVAAAAGGLFVWAGREPVIVSQVLVDLGANANITLKLVNCVPTTYDTTAALIAGEALTLQALTGVSKLVLDESNLKLSLLPFQALQLITTASAAAQLAQVTVSINRPRQW